MEKRYWVHQLLNSIPKIAAGLSTALGLVVLAGWYTNNVALIQIFPIFVPMQFNTALGFLVCGIGILSQSFGRNRLTMACGLTAVVIGFMTLLQYIFNVNLGIDQLLMKHYITVATSHPGRMAPNTALCFGITGAALLILSKVKRTRQDLMVIGILGSITAALGVVSFFGYLSGVETAYGWGNLTRMAVHTAAGFFVLGMGIFAFAWFEGMAEDTWIPNWIAFPAGIGMVTVILVEWQALNTKIGSEHSFLPVLVLILGILMTVLLVATIQLAQISWRRAKDVGRINWKLKNEITERKQAEEALRESEEKWRSLTENSSDHIMLLDIDYNIQFINHTIPDLTIEEVVGRSNLDFVPPDQHQVAIDCFERIIQSGKSDRYETRYITAEGETQYFDVRVAPVIGKDGSVVSFISNSTDVSERKRKEEANRRESLTFAAINRLFRETITCESITDAAQVCLSVAEEVTGSQYGSIAEVNSKNRFDTLAFSNPGWEQCRMAELDSTGIQDMGIRGIWGAALNCEHGLIVNDPSSHPQSVGVPEKHPPLSSFLGMPFRHKKFNGLIGIANREGGYTEMDREIIEALALAFAEVINSKRGENELRESESRFRDITQSMADWIWEVDKNGKYTYASDTVKKVLGYSSEELIGKTPFELMSAEEGVKIKEIFLEIVSKSGPIVDLENWNLAKDGTEVCLLTNGVPIVNANGELKGYRGVNKDITSQKKLAAEKAQIESQLQQAQKMESVGRLAGGVAHDYNNAISVIIGFTELAIDEVDPGGRLYANLNEVLKAASRATDITRQLLAFARKQTIAPKVLDLNENVESMLKMLRRLIGEDISLVWSPGTSLWPVKLDPSQIDQILANLCVNARDAIENVGKITIETGNATFDEAYCADHSGFVPGEFVLLAVSDNGCGMDKEILDNIFEPFFTTKDVDKGTGLGLSTVYGIAKQNNGFINVYSEPNKGTTIKIYVPRHEGKVVEIQEESTPEIPQGRGETVLVVEDDLTILKLAQQLLDGLGYTVLIAGTPGEAMGLAEKHAGEIHLLVTDVIMPEMNGRDLAQRLQSLCPDLRCMFMSGYTANVIAHHGVLDEGVYFIQKPFSKRDLAKTVRKVLDEEKPI